MLKLKSKNKIVTIIDEDNLLPIYTFSKDIINPKNIKIYEINENGLKNCNSILIPYNFLEFIIFNGAKILKQLKEENK